MDPGVMAGPQPGQKHLYTAEKQNALLRPQDVKMDIILKIVRLGHLANPN